MKQVKDTGAALVGVRTDIQREAQIHDRDVNGKGADDLLGLAGRAGPEGSHAHGLKQAGHAVGPGIRPPAAP